MTETIEERLGAGVDAIREFCEKWGIVEFALFGSVVRDDFGPESDIDVMVRFADGKRPHGLAFVGAKQELEDLLVRNVDFIEFDVIKKQSLLRSIERDITTVYAA